MKMVFMDFINDITSFARPFKSKLYFPFSLVACEIETNIALCVFGP